MPAEWEHWWINVNSKKRYCSKCGVEQERHKTTMGRINIYFPTPLWEPKLPKKCTGVKDE